MGSETASLEAFNASSKPNDEVLSLARAGQKIMSMWHDLYRETRRQIELSGKGDRWEFDQPLLFTRTDYIGSVAKDLGDVVQVNLILLKRNMYLMLVCNKSTSTSALARLTANVSLEKTIRFGRSCKLYCLSGKPAPR